MDTIDNMVLKDIPHNGFITVDTNSIKTTSTENPFSVIYKDNTLLWCNGQHRRL